MTTILNPAPAAALPDSIYPLCDYVTPNETEAEGITGVAVSSVEDARKAADALLAKGVGAAIITLGEKGALLHTRKGDRSWSRPTKSARSSRRPARAMPSMAGWQSACRAASRRVTPCASAVRSPAFR